MSATAPARAGSEAALAARWAAGFGGTLRLEDGRALRVVFPGVPGGLSGPDFRGAILDAGGDLLRGDVELHLVASGWRAHGHHTDAAYAGVVLHAVGANDEPGALTHHASGRLIPILVLPPEGPGFPPPFTPPCALASARNRLPGPALDRLGLRRLRIKAARAHHLVAAGGAGQATYALLLETIAGPANREPFASLARTLPLAALLELADSAPEHPVTGRALAFTAHLKGRAATLLVRRAGLRPMASPARRLEAAGRLFARLWPRGSPPQFPFEAVPAPGVLQGEGIGRALVVELLVNAVLPVALACEAWPESDVEQAYLALPSPGTYGRLKPLERWLGERPFLSAARLQGGLLLHADYCTRGMCGRCPLSDG